jgi:hypothetical protein
MREARRTLDKATICRHRGISALIAAQQFAAMIKPPL